MYSVEQSLWVIMRLKLAEFWNGVGLVRLNGLLFDDFQN